MTCRVGGSRFSGQGTHWASNQPLTILPRRCHRVRTAYMHHHCEQFSLCHRLPTSAPSMHTIVLQAPLHKKPFVFVPSSFPFQNHEHVFYWLFLLTYARPRSNSSKATGLSDNWRPGFLLSSCQHLTFLPSSLYVPLTTGVD